MIPIRSSLTVPLCVQLHLFSSSSTLVQSYHDNRWRSDEPQCDMALDLVMSPFKCSELSIYTILNWPPSLTLYEYIIITGGYTSKVGSLAKMVLSWSGHILGLYMAHCSPNRWLAPTRIRILLGQAVQYYWWGWSLVGDGSRGLDMTSSLSHQIIVTAMNSRTFASVATVLLCLLVHSIQGGEPVTLTVLTKHHIFACIAGSAYRSIWLTGSLGRDGRSTYLGTCRNCTEVRLSDGCSGVLSVLTKSAFGWGTATDRYFGADEVRVVCRQLNCGEVSSPLRFFTN